jgi:hypothetical protein
MVRVLVCGGREFYNKALLKKTLDELHAKTPITCIINGKCKTGADFLSTHWAVAYGGMKIEEYEANWNAQGKSAGPIRNTMMLALSHPDLVLAFPGNDGTADMVRKAKKAKVKVIEIKGESK